MSRLFMVLALMLGTSEAYSFDVFWTGTTGSWITSSSWDSLAVPDAFFEDVAIINNGGTATLNTTAIDAAGIALGYVENGSGTVVIQNGGSLTLVETAGAAVDVAPNGAANIGFEGGTGNEGDSGLIEVQGGGSLTVVTYDINQNGVLRIGTGAGSATVATSTGSLFSNGTVEVIGPGHNISIANNLVFEAKGEGSSRFVPRITNASTHSVITVGGAATLAGTLAPVFDGYTPQIGDSWDLIDAPTVGGAFNVDSSSVGTLPAGTAIVTRQRSGGSGSILEMVYKAVPTMRVNTDTGVVTLTSESGNAVNLIGYSVVSDGGQLTPGAWNSLADQGQGAWEEAGTPTVNAVNELIPQGSFALGGTTYNLGAIYNPPTEFGVAASIEFEYAEDGDERSSFGVVELSGAFADNNLVLTVDPTTGEGQLRNSSPFIIQVQGYSVLSGSGSLDDANWTSLESGSAAGWDDAASDEFSLNELVPTGDALIGAGQSYSLGDMFLVGGDEDLTLEFVLSVDGVAEVRQGLVQYGAIPAGVPGDYNNNGIVDAADYTIWRDNVGPGSLPNEGGISPGTVDNADYAFWASRYGSTSGVGAGAGAAPASVPEPGALAAVLWGLLAACGLVARRRPAFCRV
ncbi:hypothetical protein [Posidoniimonas polymericola]|uniref:hypothetical protein n=1 Tax=Posidoniimonas polymericola TaxID=2528002 RepID=UPI0018D4435B|nr:hypothetical protein [Posidoniimonas polymericola]